MSTWTSRAALAGAALALSACTEQETGAAAPREVVVARGAVLVAAPPGYCVDRTALRDAEEGSFALLASCASLDPNADGPSAQPAILTVTVSGRDPETTPPRAEALAAAAPEAVLATRQRGALALVHLGDGGDAVLPGGDPRHWRGATGTGGRVVALALYAPRESPLAGAAGGDLMAALAARIEARAPATVAVAPPQGRSGDGLRATLARLFN
ncbi:dihydroxy-acid dehydratase [Rhodosalinus sp.]|uniref:dihydroxy-acid dehydratase n=1 Tax=Rhodosalinus sp. TaxID=2047741 RepID=UPI00397993FD